MDLTALDLTRAVVLDTTAARYYGFDWSACGGAAHDALAKGEILYPGRVLSLTILLYYATVIT